MEIPEQNVLPTLSLERGRIHISWCTFLILRRFFSWWCRSSHFLHFLLIQVNKEGLMIPPQTCLRKSGHLINLWTGDQKARLWSGLYGCGHKRPKWLATCAGQPTSGLRGLSSPPEWACHRRATSWERSLDHPNCQTVSGDGWRTLWLEMVNLLHSGS